MKHTLFFLAVWLMSAPDSYCQTSKMDEYLVKDASVAAARRPAITMPSRSQGYMASADPATLSKPTIPQKLQSIIGHTQNLKNTTQVLRANTEALEANTKALLANTDALQTNMTAAKTNKHMRSEQMHLATPVPPAPKVYAPAVLAKKPVAAPPAPVAVATLPKRPVVAPPAPIAVAAVPKRPVVVAPAPVAVAAALPKAPAKPQPVAPAKEVLKPSVPVVAIVKVPMKPIEAPAENPRMISTMPVAAAPVKTAKPSAMPVENSRTISTMPLAANIKVVPTVANRDLPNPAAARSTKPMDINKSAVSAMSMVAVVSSKPAAGNKPASITAMTMPKPAQPQVVPQATAPGVAAIKMTDVIRNSKRTNLLDLMNLPLMAKMYDCKITSAKYYPVVPKLGLKHGDIITTQGYLQVVATEDSGKATESYLLQLTVNTAKGDSCFMVRIPSEQVARFGGKESSDNAKKFVRELVKGRVPCAGGHTLRKPVYVSVTGQLAYNGTHAATMRREKVAVQGKRDMNTYTAWEVSANNITFATPQ